MLRCYITDRHSAGGLSPLLRFIAQALTLGVELVQIREKDLPARELAEFTRAVMALPNPGKTLILVNGRADVALAAGAHGVHLAGGSVAPRELRPMLPERFVIGVSCHSREELFRAQAEDADYTFISPVFRPLSKDDSRRPLGLGGLREAVSGLQIPAFALGGIQPENMADCVAAGAPGVAGISLFQNHLLRS